MSIIPNYVPSSYKTVNLILTVKDLDRALHFYNCAFGAEIVSRFCGKKGDALRAEIKIADTIITLESEAEENIATDNGTAPSATVQFYTEDVEGTFSDALSAGANVVQSIKKEFNGDRSGRIRDPFGYYWLISTHMDDFTPKELQQHFQELHP